MFIYNIKINGRKTFIKLITFFILIGIAIIGIAGFGIFNGAKITGDNSIPANMVCEVKPNNYTNILKAVTDNVNEYVGTKFTFTGYIHTLADFNDNQFVLARDMIVSSNYTSLIVGFLCEYEEIHDFKENMWVTITGEITKGNYHGEIPIVKVLEIEEVEKPNDEYVYPPDNTYIPTSGLI